MPPCKPQTVEWVDDKLLELTQLLPDLVGKLDKLQAKLVLQLVADTPAVASKMVRLKGALPRADLSSIVARYPWLLTNSDVEEVERKALALRCGAAAALRRSRIRRRGGRLPHRAPRPAGSRVSTASCREALPGVDVCRLVEAEPMLLCADIDYVLEEIRRLLPGEDPISILCINPGMVIDMGAARLPASLEVDDGIKAL